MSAANTPGRLLALRGIGARVIALMASVLLMWIASRLLTRVDSKSDIGAWSVIFTALYAIATVARLGAENLALKLTSADARLGRPLARPSILVTIGAGLLGAIVLFWVTYTRDALSLLPIRAGLSVAVGLSVVPLNLAILGGAWLRSLGHIAMGALLELGTTPMATIAGVALLSLRGEVSLTAFLAIFCTALWLNAAATLGWGLLELHRASGRLTPTPIRRYLADHGRSLTAYMLTALGFYLFNYLPVLVFGFVHDDSGAADFRNSLTLATFVGLLPAMQTSYLTPTFAKLFQLGLLVDLNATVRTATRNATLLGALVALPLLIIPGQILLLVFGPSYVHAATILRILASAMLVQAALGPIYALMTTTGLEKEASRAILVLLPAGAVLMMVATRVSADLVTLAATVAPTGFAVVGCLALWRHGISSSVFPTPRPKDAA
ncbi:Membrane protein involved in the export of O-antigen and teichoic acid [Propioniciclava tarda]|nr:Membrane protein involved in the export of O-antigen and teichoic acid [Propioniciclava tarda]